MSKCCLYNAVKVSAVASAFKLSVDAVCDKEKELFSLLSCSTISSCWKDAKHLVLLYLPMEPALFSTVCAMLSASDTLSIAQIIEDANQIRVGATTLSPSLQQFIAQLKAGKFVTFYKSWIGVWPESQSIMKIWASSFIQ